MKSVNELLEDVLYFPTRNHGELVDLNERDAGELLSRLQAIPEACELMLTRGHPLAEARSILIARRAGAIPNLARVRSESAALAGDEGTVQTSATARPAAASAPSASNSRFLSSVARDLASLQPETIANPGNVLAAKKANAGWSVNALKRGTPEATERIQLTALASGASMSVEEAQRLAAPVLGES